jgi:hypothetical protein
MRYFISLPEGYRPEGAGRWPVLICVTGCDCDFRGLLEKYRQARGGRPFLLVAPCTFSNTNAIEGWLWDHYRRLYPAEVIRQAERSQLDWDEAGLLAVIDDLQRLYGGEGRVYLTGFSGGGLLTYRMLVKHPARLAGAVAVCGNFFGESAAPGDGPSQRDSGIPVRLLEGGLDPHGYYFLGGHLLPPLPLLLGLAVAGGVAAGAFVWRRTGRARGVVIVAALGTVLAGLAVVNRWVGIDLQGRAAMRLLADLGYTDVRRDTIPTMGHEPAPEQVLRALPQLTAADMEPRSDAAGENEAGSRDDRVDEGENPAVADEDPQALWQTGCPRPVMGQPRRP